MSRYEEDEYQDSSCEESVNLFINYIIMKKVITSIIISMLFFTPLFATDCNSARCTLESTYVDWIKYVEQIDLYIEKNYDNNEKLNKLLDDTIEVLNSYDFPNTEKWNKIELVIKYLLEALIRDRMKDLFEEDFPELLDLVPNR